MSVWYNLYLNRIEVGMKLRFDPKFKKILKTHNFFWGDWVYIGEFD